MMNTNENKGSLVIVKTDFQPEVRKLVFNGGLDYNIRKSIPTSGINVDSKPNDNRDIPTMISDALREQDKK